MPDISVLGIFCEDIREEKNDVLTLVGLMPDNVDIVDPDSPKAIANRLLPKICMYLRINFELNIKVDIASVRLVLPNGENTPLGVIDATVINKAREQALSRGNPLAGVIFRAVMGGLSITNSGLLRLEVDIAGQNYLAAALNINVVPNSASVSEPPSAQ